MSDEEVFKGEAEDMEANLMNLSGPTDEDGMIPMTVPLRPDPQADRFCVTLENGECAVLDIPTGITLRDWNKIDAVWQALKPKQRRQRKKADNAE